MRGDETGGRAGGRANGRAGASSRVGAEHGAKLAADGPPANRGGAGGAAGTDLLGEQQALHDLGLLFGGLVPGGAEEAAVLVVVALGVEDHGPPAGRLLLKRVVLDDAEADGHAGRFPDAVLAAVLDLVLVHFGVHFHHLRQPEWN